MSKPEDSKLLASLIFDRYGKIVLNTKETAAVIGVTEEALKKDRQEAIGIPFTRRNDKENGQPLYSVTAIAKTLVDNEKKTI